MKILITGASGFLGKYLIDQLLREKDSYHIYGLWSSSKPRISEKIAKIQCDILLEKEVDEMIERIKPDIVFHLAGKTHGLLEELLSVNVVGTRNILEAVRMHCQKTHIFVVSSSAVYGYAGSYPIPEAASLFPLSDYGVSKAAEELVVKQYEKQYSLSTTVLRPFNAIGPGQGTNFLVGSITNQIKDILCGAKENIELRNTSSYRDYIDVRDVANAFVTVIKHMCTGTYNIGSGNAWSTKEIIDCCSTLTGKSFSLTLTDPCGKDAIPVQISNNNKMKKIGWNQTICMEQSLSDMLGGEDFLL